MRRAAPVVRLRRRGGRPAHPGGHRCSPSAPPRPEPPACVCDPGPVAPCRAAPPGGRGQPGPPTWAGRPPLRAASVPLRVVYTALHGVAASLALRAIERAGFPPPLVVAAQQEPDPDFPTVAFPNPEEPGTLDLALAQARADGADLVLANDPDGDRLAVAVPDPAAPRGWRVLSGGPVGAPLGPGPPGGAA